MHQIVLNKQTSASLLSHYQEGFPLGASWLLFFAGLINFLVGIAFRSRLKLRRSLFRSKRQLSEKRDVEEGGGEAKLTTTKNALWTLANTSIDRAKKGSKGGKSKRGGHEQESLLKPQISSIRTPLDAFELPTIQSHREEMMKGGRAQARTNTSLSATSEMLRNRARQENWRIERQEEEEMDRGNGGATSVLLVKDYQWDTSREIPFPRAETMVFAEPATLTAQIKRGQAGASRDLSVGVPKSPGFRTAFQRRSLVLSKMVQQVKRGSTGSKKKKRLSKIPPLPNRYAKKLITREAPGAWMEVKKSEPNPQPPSPTYRPDRSTIYEDLCNDGTRSRYHSCTPIADRYAYHAR